MSRATRSWVAGVGLAAAFATAPTAVVTVVTPAVSNAEVCAEAGGRHVDVGGCTHIAGDIAAGVEVANDDEAAAQAAAGQPPCFTASGVAYYTPGDAPCT